MRQHSICLGHEALAFKSMHNHVDLSDDALDPLVGLLRLQLQLQDQPVDFVHHKAKLDLQPVRAYNPCG